MSDEETTEEAEEGKGPTMGYRDGAEGEIIFCTFSGAIYRKGGWKSSPANCENYGPGVKYTEMSELRATS